MMVSLVTGLQYGLLFPIGINDAALITLRITASGFWILCYHKDSSELYSGDLPCYFVSVLVYSCVFNHAALCYNLWGLREDLFRVF